VRAAFGTNPSKISCVGNGIGPNINLSLVTVRICKLVSAAREQIPAAVAADRRRYLHADQTISA
jgi:hypothetical protein